MNSIAENREKQHNKAASVGCRLNLTFMPVAANSAQFRRCQNGVFQSSRILRKANMLA
jgi:hypothetical protein